MTVILLLFYLFMPPTDKLICSLWLSQSPTPSDLAAACPEGIDLEQYSVRFVNLVDGSIDCQKNAAAIWAIDQACHFGDTQLSFYRMDIVLLARDNDELLCAIRTGHKRPTRREIAEACPESALNAYDKGIAHLRLMGEVKLPEVEQNAIEIPTPQAGTGLFDQVSAVDELRTDERLSWLAGRMIWHGLVEPECDGGTSGLDPVTLAANQCGLESATPLMDDWQNQFDAEIYAAALSEGVPARLLKRIVRIESQYWPLWDASPDGETGMAQITAMGADTYLRWYMDGYGYFGEKDQQDQRNIFLNSLRCEICDVDQAVQKERENIVIYARILKSYRYASSDWRAALVLWNGQPYLDKVEQIG